MRRPRGNPLLPGAGAVYPTLDLHGATGDEARRLADRWLRVRRAEGVRTVRIVTGRGNRSGGPPVVRAEIEHLLEDRRGGVVADFHLERGEGAFLVSLHRPRPSARRSDRVRDTPPSDLDPELLRRAEEALWELGIDPTPELLDAEIRRLRQGPDERA